MQEKFSRQRVVYFVLLIFWASLIFYFSSIPDLSSGLDSTVDLILRKGAHIFVYAILAFLLLKNFDNYSLPYLFLVGIISVLYATSDEIHQLSVGGRQGSIVDIGIDSIGVLLGIIFSWFLRPKADNRN